MSNKLNNLIVTTFSILGILCVFSGTIMPTLVKTEHAKVGKIEVTQQKVTNCKSNEIKLKDLNIEINSTLDTNVKNYLTNPEDIDDSILSKLKLDTSNINVNNIGSYYYTITYNKKIYNATVNVNAKALPIVDDITLNQLAFETNTDLPSDVSFYVKENLSEEVKNATKIDLTGVNINKAGKYLYSISYNGKFYTNTITIYEPKAGTNN